MSLSLQKAFGIFPASIELRARRLELLSSNLANADTPNYKAKDFDYKRILAEIEGGGAGSLRIRRTHERHLPPPSRGGGLGETESLYRVPAQPSLDGNTVDPQLERAAFAENAVQYQSSLEFLNRRVSSLKQALSKAQ